MAKILAFKKFGLGLTVAMFSPLAHAEDLGFRFDVKKKICVNDKGQIGHNPDFMGDCGLLKNADLKWRPLTFPWDAMPGAILDGANLYGINIQTTGPYASDPPSDWPDYGISFRGASLQSASLKNVDLRLANFESVNLSDVDLTGSKFGNSNFSVCDFSSANLAGLDLSDTGVRMSNFSGANLTSASFRGNENMHQAKFDGATLEKANLQGAHLYGASFREALLSDADFSHAILIGADLTDAEVNGALFNQASYNEDTLLPFSQDEAKRRGMRFVSNPNSAGKMVAIQGNSDGTCAPKEIHLTRGEKVVISLKGDPAIMFMLTIPDFQIELMTMGADPVRKPYTPNSTGTFKFTCGPHGAPDDKQTHGTIMVM